MKFYDRINELETMTRVEQQSAETACINFYHFAFDCF